MLTRNYKHRRILTTQGMEDINTIRFFALMRSLKYCCKDKTCPWNMDTTSSRVKSRTKPMDGLETASQQKDPITDNFCSSFLLNLQHDRYLAIAYFPAFSPLPVAFLTWGLWGSTHSLHISPLWLHVVSADAARTVLSVNIRWWTGAEIDRGSETVLERASSCEEEYQLAAILIGAGTESSFWDPNALRTKCSWDSGFLQPTKLRSKS